MFIAVRKYRVRRGSTVGWAQRVRDSFVPLMRELAGFRGYYLLDGGPDELITISMFDSADEALVSNAKAADWLRNNVLDFTRGLPEVMRHLPWASTRDLGASVRRAGRARRR